MANRSDHLIVFIISTLLFLTGIFAGIMVSRVKLTTIETKITDFEQNINSLELNVLISDALQNETLSCRFLQGQLNQTRELLNDLGEEVVAYEEQLKLEDAYYREIKKRYNSVRAEYWLMLEKLKNKCNNNYTTILFFYSTIDPCPDCRDQGFILSYIATKDSNMYVVPLDADEDLLVIDMLKEAYEVNETPMLVVDSSIIVNGLIDEEELLELINP
jgi:hypothetical protein